MPTVLIVDDGQHGLPISREIVDEQGGRRRLQSQIGIDPTFAFPLPVAVAVTADVG